MASETAVAYGINPVLFLETIKGESHWNQYARGDGGWAQGLCQIRVDMWEVSTQQADDPVFCLNWMAEKWREGHANYWSYYKFHVAVHNPGVDPILPVQ